MKIIELSLNQRHVSMTKLNASGSDKGAKFIQQGRSPFHKAQTNHVRSHKDSRESYQREGGHSAQTNLDHHGAVV